MITQSLLKEQLEYNPDTGIFVRKHYLNNADKPVGHKCSIGYIQIRINGIRYYAHRLAWLYMTGENPDKYVDHINHDRSDNRFCNLRLATHSENIRNSKISKHNTTGYKGVQWSSRYKKYKAVIRKDNKNIYLGVFDNPEDAYKEYCEAAKKYHGDFASYK